MAVSDIEPLNIEPTGRAPEMWKYLPWQSTGSADIEGSLQGFEVEIGRNPRIFVDRMSAKVPEF